MYLFKHKYEDFIRFNVVKHEKFTLSVVNSVEFRFDVNQHANNRQLAAQCGEMKRRTSTSHNQIKSLIDRCHKLIQVKARKPSPVFCFDVRAGFEQQTNNWRVALFAGNMKWRASVLNQIEYKLINFLIVKKRQIPVKVGRWQLEVRLQL